MAVNNYGIPHQRFLQGMMCRKICKASKVRELFDICFTEKPLIFEEHIIQFVRNINSRISRFHMEIRKGIDEEDGSHYYCLINCHESALSLQPGNYSPKELEYFQKLVEAIVCSSTGTVSSITALHLAGSLTKPMSVTDAEQLLKQLADDKWIVQSPQGDIVLSTLSIVELSIYIREMFPDDVQMCTLCKQIVIRGEECNSCNVKIHCYCVKRVSLKTCPQCNVKWPSVSGSIAGSAKSTNSKNSINSQRSTPASQNKKRK